MPSTTNFHFIYRKSISYLDLNEEVCALIFITALFIFFSIFIWECTWHACHCVAVFGTS